MNFRRKVIMMSLRTAPGLLREIIQNNINTIERLLSEDPKKCTISDQSRRTPLHLAASLGRAKIVDLLLTHECYSVNYRDSELVTPLHRACRNNHVETVQVLLSHGVDVNARTRQHITPLHVCCSYNSLECARLIVGQVSNINATDQTGTTALHYAVFQNNLEMIELLLENGALVEVQDKQGRRPIHHAAIINSPPVIRRLVEAGCDVNVRNKDLLTPLHFSIAYKHQDAFAELLRSGANLEAQDIGGNMAAHWAAYMGCERIFDEIMRRVPINSPNLEGITPLHYACCTHNGDASAVKIMDAVPDVDLTDKYQRTPLHFACMNGREKMAIELIGRGANSNFNDCQLETPLHKATQNCHQNMMCLLLNNGVQIDTANKDGYTPLHFAVIAGLPWNCAQLIKAGANPLLCDNSGRTAHFMAVYKGTFDCLLSLMHSSYYSKENLVDSNFAVFPDLDAFNRSLLHYAAASSTCPHDFLEILLMRRSLKLVSALPPELNTAIESAFKRFNINQRDIYGRTPLHYVCLRESMDMDNDTPFLVEMLLEAGADATILDNDGRLPFHYAVANGYNSVLEMLIQLQWFKTRSDILRSFIKCCPLRAACYHGNCAAISQLVGFGFRNFEPAIEIATRRGHWNCVLKLKNFITSSQLYHKLARIAAYNGHSNGLRIFLGAHTEMELEDILFMAAASRDGTQCLEVLFEKRVNIQARDRHGRNALFYAVLSGNFESVKLLLVSGVRLVKDTLGKSVFHLICSKGDFDMFRLFHNLSKDHGFYGHMCAYLLTKDDDGFCPMEVACVKGHQLLIEYYLATMNKGFEQKMMYFAGFVSNGVFIEHILKKNGPAFVNLVGPFKRSLLHYVCLSKRTNEHLLKLLLFDDSLKFDIHLMDTNDLTPLLCAASIGNAATVKYLLENTQSDIMATDLEMNTILHLACMSGSTKCALTVIEQAERQGVLEELMMSRNAVKQVPLHLAALKSLSDVVVELLGKGASVSDKDDYGYTPANYCARDATAAYCLSLLLVIIEMDIQQETRQQFQVDQDQTIDETSMNETTMDQDDADESMNLGSTADRTQSSMVSGSSLQQQQLKPPSRSSVGSSGSNAPTITSSLPSVPIQHSQSHFASSSTLLLKNRHSLNALLENRARRLSYRSSLPASSTFSGSCDSSEPQFSGRSSSSSIASKSNLKEKQSAGAKTIVEEVSNEEEEEEEENFEKNKLLLAKRHVVTTTTSKSNGSPNNNKQSSNVASESNNQLNTSQDIDSDSDMF